MKSLAAAVFLICVAGCSTRPCVDGERTSVAPYGFGSTDFLASETRNVMEPLWKAYAADHNGQGPDEVAQLMPYAQTPEQQAAVQKTVLKHNSDSK